MSFLDLFFVTIFIRISNSWSDYVVYNVPLSKFEKKPWTRGYSALYSDTTSQSHLNAIPCNNDDNIIFVGAINLASPSLVAIGAYAYCGVLTASTSSTSQAFKPQGPKYLKNHPLYNVYWYDYYRKAFGFADNSYIQLSNPDVAAGDGRLSWRLEIGSGYRAGPYSGYGSNYRKIIYYTNSEYLVPETTNVHCGFHESTFIDGIKVEGVGYSLPLNSPQNVEISLCNSDIDTKLRVFKNEKEILQCDDVIPNICKLADDEDRWASRAFTKMEECGKGTHKVNELIGGELSADNYRFIVEPATHNEYGMGNIDFQVICGNQLVCKDNKTDDIYSGEPKIYTMVLTETTTITIDLCESTVDTALIIKDSHNSRIIGVDDTKKVINDKKLLQNYACGNSGKNEKVEGELPAGQYEVEVKISKQSSDRRGFINVALTCDETFAKNRGIITKHLIPNFKPVNINNGEYILLNKKFVVFQDIFFCTVVGIFSILLSICMYLHYCKNKMVYKQVSTAENINV